MAYQVFGVHVHFGKCLLVTFRLKNWVPPEIVAAPRSNDGSMASTYKSHRSCIRSFAKGKDTLCISSLVFKSIQQFDKSLGFNTLKEVFDVRSWQTIQGVEAQADVFSKTRRLGDLTSGFYFFNRYKLRLALKLIKIYLEI